MVLRLRPGGHPSPFAGITATPAAHAPAVLRPAASRRMVIYFTPRSSSSRLTEILSRTGRLGMANEAFNPAFVRDIATRWGVNDPESYIELLLRRHNAGDVYSCEITAYHLHVVFPDHAPFLRAFADAPCFWLIRRDIVAQAVSLAKMVHTGVGHTAHSTMDSRQDAEQRFSYDRNEIWHWLDHIRTAEILSERFFARHRITPLRICYEQLVRLHPAGVVSMVTRHAGLPTIAPEELRDQMRAMPLAHQKIGTVQNDEYAARFRAEGGSRLARLEADRVSLLERLHDVTHGRRIPTAGELRLENVQRGFPAVLSRHKPLLSLRDGLQRLIRSRW